MRRHDENLDQALKKLDENVIWLPSRFEKNREALSSKLHQRSVSQLRRQTRRRKNRWLPVLVTVVFLGIFAGFIFQMMSNQQDIATDDIEEQDQTNTSEQQETDSDQAVDDTEQNDEIDQEPPQPLLADLYEPEKEMEIMLEGMPETIKVELETNDDWRYIIYVDKDLYVFHSGEEADRIELKEPLDSDIPEVAMEIRRLDDGIDKEEVIKLIHQEIENDGLTIDREEDITWPLTALSIVAFGEERTEHGKFGYQWDTPLHKYYVVQGGAGEVFVIKQMYFLEAAEGHGARFDQLLETFEIVS